MIKETVSLVIIYVLSMGLHEIMHIKSQRLTTGTIWVHRAGMTCLADDVISWKWFLYAGGILTSPVMFIMAALDPDSVHTLGFLTAGWLHLCYGCYEGYAENNIRWVRYLIYAGVISINVIAWQLI